MNINEYAVQELNEEEIISHSGGLMFFLTGLIIGLMIAEMEHHKRPY